MTTQDVSRATAPASPTPEDVKAFAGRLLNIYTGGMLSLMIEIGYRTGLFEALAQGAGDSESIAERAGLNERYVREWLNGLVAAGIVLYEPNGRLYSLPAAHAACLTGDSASNAAPLSGLISTLARPLAMVTKRFRGGGGVPYKEYHPEFTNLLRDIYGRVYDQYLISAFLTTVPGLVERLKAGIRVADVGCGAGRVLNLMAAEYPESTFTGYDVVDGALAMGREEAKERGLSNVQFQEADAVSIPSEPGFDLIMAFDMVHDLADPARVLERVRQCLTPGGVFFMVDFKFSSNVEDNVGNPFAPLYYAVSTLHCMPVSLSEGGAGLGTMWGRQTAERMLKEAGFSQVEVHDSPRPQNCIYVCRP